MKSMLRLVMPVAAAALALTSCSNDAAAEVVIEGEPKTLEVNATIDQTRTAMAFNHTDLEWSADDEIYLYIGEAATECNIVHPISSSRIKAAYKENDNVYANYSLDNSSSAGVREGRIKIAAEQTQSAANVFAGKNMPMIAKGTIENGKVNLEFSPVGCVLVFNVYGPVENERIKSIKFETSAGCCGEKLCDLTAEPLDYTADGNSTSVTVTLDAPAAIGTAKPTDTRTGEHQVYMVVAPVNYGDAVITVTTEAGQTYTFKTANGIDCSTNTARVVNLNLAKAPELKPTIEVPTVEEQQSSDGGELVIGNIVFRNIASEKVEKADVGVYGDAELIRPLENPWLAFNNTTTLANGQLYCNIAPNDAAERTAYIGIKCAGVQAAIAITQAARGVSTGKYFVKVTEAPGDWTGEYLIVYEGENETLAFNGALTGDAIKNERNYIDNVEITAQGILSNDKTNTASVRISKKEGSTDEYMLQTASNLYIYSPSNKSQLLSYSTDYSTAAIYHQYIGIEEGSARIACEGAVLRFNESSELFKYYKSTSTGSPIQLYKLQ